MNKITQIHTELVDKERDLLNKKKFLETKKVESQYNQLMERIESEGSLDITDDDKKFATGSISAANAEYVDAINNRLPFVNADLSEFICLGGKTAYLIGGCTGQGKSTVVANIVEPILDKGKKVLVVSNEEAREDVYNRVACQRLGMSFRLFKRGKLHPEQNAKISEEAEKLQSVLTVISVDFKGNPDFVTTPQGLAAVFEKFAFDHDIVILDYYQNINHSVASVGDMRPEAHVHQEKFAFWLNHFKNKYGKPIVIFSQLKRPSKTDAYAFEERVMGRKYIATVTLMHIEIRPDFENYTTSFICHKDRFWGMAGKMHTVGFDWMTNRFVRLDDAFKAKVLQWQLDDKNNGGTSQEEAKDALAGLTDEGDGQPDNEPPLNLEVLDDPV